MIQLVHDRNASNAGDIASVPSNYFDLGHEIRAIDIRDAVPVEPDVPTIIGGGGLMCHRERLAPIVERATAPVIGWGIGLNESGAALLDSFPEWCRRFALLGVRDAGTPYRCVPCASCMHPIFDQEFPVEHDVVAYLGLPFDTHGVPWMHCCGGQSVEDAVRFIASGHVVVTSSYHGMYWATLLGREVLCVPNHDSSKFYRFPFPVPIVKPNAWRSRIGDATSYEDALRHCRRANVEFANDVRQLLSGWSQSSIHSPA